MLVRLCLLPFLFYSLEAFAQIDLQDGLVACYAFTGNANDGSGNGYNGIVNGAALTTDRFGNESSAYSFSGQTYISIPNGPFVANATYTYALWAFMPSGISLGSASTLLSVGDAEGIHSTISVANHYSSADFYGWTVGGYNKDRSVTGLHSNQSPLNNTWYHIAGVRTSNSMLMYLNGILIASASTEGKLPAFYQDFSSSATIGIRCSFIQGFSGKIDDVTIYSRPLSALEIDKLYREGAGCMDVPQADASDQSKCGGGDFSITATNGTIYRWYDSPTEGQLLFEGNPFMISNLTATASYYLANVARDKESARKKVTITIHNPPNFSCSLVESATVGEPIVFKFLNVTGTTPLRYAIDFGDQQVDGFLTSMDYPHVYNLAGDFNVTSTLTDANDCVAVCEQEILILNYATANDQTNCGAKNFSVVAEGGAAYRWYNAPAGGQLLFEGNPLLLENLSETTSYYVSNVVNDKESLRKKVTITVHPQPELTCSLPDVVNVEEDAELVLSVESGTSPFEYTIDFGDEEQISGTLTSQIYPHRYKESGDYDVVATITDVNKCLASCEEKTSVLSDVYIPNVITPNEDTFNEIFSVYIKKPDETFVRYSGQRKFNMNIFNRWGNLIFSTNDVAEGWSAKNQASGIYYYDITFGTSAYKGTINVVR